MEQRYRILRICLNMAVTLLLFFPHGGVAQTALTWECNSFRDGDSLVKMRVNDMVSGEGGKNQHNRTLDDPYRGRQAFLMPQAYNYLIRKIR